jgi:hypothetical protein
MSSEPRGSRPAWWLLYTMGLVLAGLIGLVDASVAEGGPRVILELTMAAFMVALMIVWVRQNRAAMELEHVKRLRKVGIKPH